MPFDVDSTASDPAPRSSWPRRLATTATSLAALGLTGAVAAAFMPVWPCLLLEHFAVQLVAGGAIVVACAAALRVRGYLDLAAVATLISALRVAPDLCSVPSPLPSDGTTIRVLLLNVHTQSASFDEVRRLIADLDPDVIGLVEVDQRWLVALAPALAGYAGRIEAPRADNFGVALYAREPVTAAIEERRDGAAREGARVPRGIERLASELPSVVAGVTVGGAHLGVVLVHPPPPISAAALARQIGAFDATADRARQLQHPVVIMGDFNATPWSSPFQRLLARSGLCDTRRGFGLAPSFPAASTLLRIPIDHALATCAIGVKQRRVERDVGSDHLPVFLELVVPRQP